jgi:hypothetical protein
MPAQIAEIRIAEDDTLRFKPAVQIDRRFAYILRSRYGAT